MIGVTPITPPDGGLAKVQGHVTFDPRVFASSRLTSDQPPTSEMMAAIAPQNYEQRRDRRSQRIKKARAAGKYQGRPNRPGSSQAVRELLEASFGVRGYISARKMFDHHSHAHSRRTVSAAPRRRCRTRYPEPNPIWFFRV